MCSSEICINHPEKNEKISCGIHTCEYNRNYSIESVWENFSTVLRNFISSRVSNHSYVDDILQDVFIKIHMNVDSLKDSTKIRSWVFQIANNTIIDFYRKQKIKTEDIDSVSMKDDFSNSPMEKLLDKSPEQEIASGLRQMINTLPEKYSQALYLVELEGLSQVELANRLGISVSGAKSRVQRGRLMLRDSLMNCCHFEFDRYGTIIDFYPICCCCCCKKEK